MPVLSTLITLALEGSQLHATEDAEMDERKTDNVDSLMFNDNGPLMTQI